MVILLPSGANRGGNPRQPPKRAPKVLVMWEDGCMISQRLAHNAKASMSHATTPAFDIVVSHPEQGLRRPGSSLAHFDEA
jgi:hypothetical protein